MKYACGVLWYRSLAGSGLIGRYDGNEYDPASIFIAGCPLHPVSS